MLNIFPVHVKDATSPGQNVFCGSLDKSASCCMDSAMLPPSVDPSSPRFRISSSMQTKEVILLITVPPTICLYKRRIGSVVFLLPSLIVLDLQCS